MNIKSGQASVSNLRIRSGPSANIHATGPSGAAFWTYTVPMLTAPKLPMPEGNMWTGIQLFTLGWSSLQAVSLVHLTWSQDIHIWKGRQLQVSAHCCVLLKCLFTSIYSITSSSLSWLRDVALPFMLAPCHPMIYRHMWHTCALPIYRHACALPTFITKEQWDVTWTSYRYVFQKRRPWIILNSNKVNLAWARL